jgi:hypothetical protein
MDIYKYRYAIKNLIVTLDMNYALQEGSITYFYIQHDYTNRRMPIIRANIKMDIAMIKLFYENLETAKLKMDLYEQQLDGNENIIATSLYWQHTFTMIPARDQTNYIASDDTTTSEVIDQMQNLQLVEVYLIDMDAVNWFTTKICTMFSNCSKAAALHAVMQMRNIPSKIAIVTPPVNNTILDNMILPLGDLINNINTINQGYGVYETYPIIYYDLVNLYCIDKLDPNITIPLAKEYGNIVFMLKNFTTPDHQVCGSYNDATSKTHYINLNDVPTINDYTQEIGSTKFSTVASIDKNGTVSKATVNDATALTYVYAHSDQTVNQVVNETMYGPTVQVSTNNCAVSFLKPWKVVTFDMDTQYQNLGLDKGNQFRILDWSLSMTREGDKSGSYYIHDLAITLQQKTKDG